MSISPSPVVDRRRLRTELRTARQEAGLTQDAVAAEMDWSLSKIIRIETGAVSISTNDLKALLRLYHVNNPNRIKELLAAARAARQRSWWSKYRGSLGPVFFKYLEYETAASDIREYESALIPGLLQTEQYATKVIRQYRENYTPKVVETRVEIRMMRQKLLLDQPEPPQLSVVLDEAVVRRVMGDKDVRKAQIEHLANMANRSNVTIQMLPFGVGLHRGMADTFSILEFRDQSDNDVLYFESAHDVMFSRDEADEVSIYRELFEHLRKVSSSPNQTLAFLGAMAKEIA
jgi:transcriptional regulator with XRE-family HTH domain